MVFCGLFGGAGATGAPAPTARSVPPAAAPAPAAPTTASAAAAAQKKDAGTSTAELSQAAADQVDQELRLAQEDLSRVQGELGAASEHNEQLRQANSRLALEKAELAERVQVLDSQQRQVGWPCAELSSWVQSGREGTLLLFTVDHKQAQEEHRAQLHRQQRDAKQQVEQYYEAKVCVCVWSVRSVSY